MSESRRSRIPKRGRHGFLVPERGIDVNSLDPAAALSLHGLKHVLDLQSGFGPMIRAIEERSERFYRIGENIPSDRAFLGALVTSEKPEVRILASPHIGRLAGHDPLFAAELWSRLIRDPNGLVREVAFSDFSLDTWRAPIEERPPAPFSQDQLWCLGPDRMRRIINEHTDVGRVVDFMDPTWPIPSMPLPEAYADLL